MPFAVTNFRNIGCSICVVAILAWLPPTADGQQEKSWGRFATFRRVVEANPNKQYTLTESQGPWMILAGTFAGPTAEQEANELVLEMRKRFKWKAFLHRQSYDFTEPVVGHGVDQYGEPKKMRYKHSIKFDEIAVLVGDFPSVDDPTLQSTLKAIKVCQPACLQLDNRTTSSLRFAGLRNWHKKISSSADAKRKGPLGKAFVTRNPLLPQELFTPTGFDSLVQQMNSGVKYSLLSCPAKYTVRVATFRGRSFIDPRKVEEVIENGQMESTLTQAAEDAHRLTEELRKRGVEAYEFHDRHESLVTVGSFKSVGTPREDGRIEIDPQILSVIKNYGGRPTKLPDGTTAPVQQTLAGIRFDVQPTPVEVPKRSIAADYSRSGSRW